MKHFSIQDLIWHQDYIYLVIFNHIDKPKVISQSQKSKADDFIFIKITMSNHPHPPPGKVSKKQDRAILPK